MIDIIFADRKFCDEIAALAAHVTPHGDRNALAQLLVKRTAPYPTSTSAPSRAPTASSIQTIAVASTSRCVTTRYARSPTCAPSMSATAATSASRSCSRSAACSGCVASHFVAT